MEEGEKMNIDNPIGQLKHSFALHIMLNVCDGLINLG